jgi:molybdopterin molybdotransferase
MLLVEDAIDRLIAAGRVLNSQIDTENCATFSALNRILATDLTSPVDVPPADNSAMDGYAFLLADAVRHDFKLPVSQRIPAGRAPEPLEPGTAARIFTGAELPENADTVAMQEDCRERDGVVSLPSEIRRAANVRPKGQDVSAGEFVLRAGSLLRPQAQGLLASIGYAEVPVYRRLKVAVFSSGDELVEPGRSLGPAQIYNSNRYTLSGLLSAWGMEMVDCGVCEDTPEAVESMLLKAASLGDVVVSSGGVSVGEEDHIKAVVTKLGQIDFWKIKIKPGKPIAFGEVRGTPFFGLPGNPVSVFVTAMILLRPYLLAAAGRTHPLPQGIQLPAQFDRKLIKRQEYLRVRRDNQGLDLFPNQSSGVLSSASWADGLAIQRADESVTVGKMLDFYPFAELLSP